MRRGLGPSGTTLNLSSNIRIIGVPGEQEEQEIENLFEKNGELPQYGKGNRLTGSTGSPEHQKAVGPRKHTPKHIIITLPKNER